MKTTLSTLLAGALVAGALAPSLALADTKHAKAAPAKAAPAAAPKPSGPAKAYKGPEGELVVMVEVNDSKEMFVHLQKIGGDLDGKTLLYLFEDRGDGNKDVYINKKRGSKTYRSVILTARENRWDFYHPTKSTTHFSIRYSEEASEKVKLDDVLAAYKP